MPSNATLRLYVLSSVVVLLSAAGVCLFHWLRKRPKASAYLWGAGAWLVSVAIKIVLAIAVFGGLALVWGEHPPLIPTMVLSGLLTGMTECVLTGLVACLKRWRTASWDSVVGFGLGFGCFEAFLLAALLLPCALLALAPEILDPEDAAALLDGLSSRHRPFTFFFERAIAIPVHLLSSVLVMHGVQRGRLSLFAWGLALKSLIDAVPAEGELPEIVLQGIYGLFGLGSLIGFVLYARSRRAENQVITAVIK